MTTIDGTGSAGPTGAARRLPSPWLLLAAAILSEVAATLSLRGALEHPALYAVVVAGYVLSYGLLVLVLKGGMGLGVAYGIWGACGVVLTALASALLFDEMFTAMKIAGIVLVAGGVAVVELGAQRAARTAPVPPAVAPVLAPDPVGPAAVGRAADAPEAPTAPEVGA